MEGIVICSTGRWCEVFSNNKIYRCTVKGNLRLRGIKTTNPVAVGDIVEFIPAENELIGQISKIKERKNVIIRRSTNLSKQTHILAANIDLALLIVTPILPRTSTGFIDRFLITAESYHIPTLIVFNKKDLFENNREIVDYYKEIYKSAKYPTIEVSAITGENIDKLKKEIAGKTILLSGHSGVGKSAILMAISPDINVKTESISKVHFKGMHTTTFARLYNIKNDTFIIDSPGIKEFGVVDFEQWELGHWFREFAPFIPDCRYANCTHQHEPECAIRDAVEKGLIHEERYQNYLGILNNISEDRNY